MAEPPDHPRAAAFFDGQNLFHSAKLAFGHTFPSYDPLALAHRICGTQGWRCDGVRFYTGVPDKADNPFWNHFWTAKCAQMGREGATLCTWPLRCRNTQVRLPDGTVHSVLSGDEKGIDVHIAIDMIRLANERAYDVALLFSRDQDFAEVARGLRIITRQQGRWLKIASAFPRSPAARALRGVDLTDWIAIDRAVYEACLDRRDYRPKPA